MSENIQFHNGWGASSVYTAVSKKKKGVPLIIFIPENKSNFEAVFNEIALFKKELELYAFPSYSMHPFEEARPLSSVMAERSNTLYNIANQDDFILLVSPYGLLKTIPPKDVFLKNILTIRKMDILPYQELSEYLDKLGYIQVEFVTDEGEYAFRGGIADVFPIGEKYPLRIEYFDDEIEALFFYNIESQRKHEDIDDCNILPCSDLIISTKEFQNKLQNTLWTEKSEAFGKFAGYQWLTPFIYDNYVSILDYIDNYDVAALMPDYESTLYDYKNIIISNLPEENKDIYEKNFISIDYTLSKLQSRNIYTICEITDSIESNSLDIQSSRTKFSFEKRNLYQAMTNTVETIKELNSQQITSIFSIESGKFNTIFKDFLRDYDIIPKEILSISEASSPDVYIYRQRITGGFIDIKNKLAVISDSDVFGFTKRKAKPKKKEVFNTQLSDLEEGDYIVHVNHGIGIYRGIKHMTIAGSEGDFLDLLYDGDDVLYVPLHNINQIQKYIGMQDHKPALNSLKSSAWQKLKKHAKESAKNIAQDLLRLYAERKAKHGFSFQDDGSFIELFENSFEFEETEDQLSAIIDVYKDMESQIPMERLVCGDVGFGKTEVAMRAACKAAACGKQVALLVPTTILARQHYETFKERFKTLPVNIDFISRFRTNKETKEIFQKVQEHKIDILIGTHKILSKDLEFFDLGLLIVDEEQRFGVSHKEKIASIKRNVDTLTLSATPIPRTLQLSLSGIRDMSIIETPPENRLPVIVKVIKGQDERIKAIKKELERGGQVFFLHNKVMNIQEITMDIKASLPHARIDFAHGQMDAKTLEKILTSFYHGEIDVLIATTIIENGINIPNVNTIIINNAANFGLAQLYQLKGRVGRSDKRGYCYLAVDNFSALNPVAQKRLSIIQQLSDLGSGFKIAMYDLQLRGAGNILGAEQSGFVVKIGYELYVAMIEEAVKEMKGEFASLTDTEVNSNIPYFIPADYIENPRIRFDFYRRFASIYDIHNMKELVGELISEYGDMPAEVTNLAYIMLIKNLAGKLGALKLIIGKTGNTKIQFAVNTRLDPMLIHKCSQERNILYRFISEYELSISVDSPNPLDAVAGFFENMTNLLTSNEVE